MQKGYRGQFRKRKKRAHNRVFVRSKNVVKKSKKDHSWKNRKVSPYKRGESGSRFSLFRIKVSILVISLVATFSILLFHPFFLITDIRIEPTDRIDAREVEDTVSALLAHKQFFFLPMNNFFLVDMKEIEDILYARYPIEKLTIQKHFPKNITMDIQEKISTLIYDNGHEFAYIDTNGHVTDVIRYVGDTEWHIMTKTVTSTDEFGEEIRNEREVSRTHIISPKKISDEMGEYPIIYHKDDAAREGLKINNHVLKKNSIDYVLLWKTEIEKQTFQNKDLHVSHVTIEREVSSIEIHLVGGGYILVSLSNTDRQIDELKTVFKALEQKERGSFEYIDTRIPGKAYWR